MPRIFHNHLWIKLVDLHLHLHLHLYITLYETIQPFCQSFFWVLHMYIRWTVLTTRTPAVTMECQATPPSSCSATESLQITVGPGKQVRFYFIFYFLCYESSSCSQHLQCTIPKIWWNGRGIVMCQKQNQHNFTKCRSMQLSYRPLFSLNIPCFEQRTTN